MAMTVFFPLLLLFALLGSLFGYTVSDLTHPGEQTAKLMLPDTDGYCTINLKPGLSQSFEFKRLLDSFSSDPSIKNELKDLMAKIDAESGIDFEEEVLPWLGPELALGVVLWPGMFETGNGPMPTIMVGTSDEAAAQALVQKWLAIRLEGGEPITLRSETYREVGITVVNDGSDAEFYAVTGGYILAVFRPADLARVYATIDLMKDSGVSLWDNPNFQQARANLPERMGMGYFDAAHFLSLLGGTIDDPSDMAAFNTLTPYAPPFIAFSISCIDKGLKLHFYWPTTEAWNFAVGEPNPLSVTNLLPSDILGCEADQNIKAWWDEVIKVLSSIPSFTAS